jgi:hypothetical protein
MEEDKIIVDLPEIDFYKEYTLKDVYKVPQHFEEVTKDHEPDQYLYIIGDLELGWLDTYYIKHIFRDEEGKEIGAKIYDTRVKVIEIPEDEVDFDEELNIEDNNEINNNESEDEE